MKKSMTYSPISIEEKWLAYWEKRQLFYHTADGMVGQKATSSRLLKEKLYLLFAFAYPSGSGLHVGHVESKTALDILARYNRMNGKDVFFPVGWDAFGLPAENYAIKTGVPPVETTRQAIDTFRRQVKRLGISYDWATEIATCHPGYYKWTQWLFLQLYDKGLAYRGSGMVNWCPSCQTVLANEQVVEGMCERCGTQVIQKDMEQWFFKITQYKDELISGLDEVDWPEPTKQQQLHWIGKSEGIKIKFVIKDTEQHVECFTTRIDTVFGVTFVVLSPEKLVEWGLLDCLTADKKSVIQTYLDKARKKTEEERQIGEKDKSGVDTGLRAVNPVNQAEIPIYVADYVLAGYGTGAVMGVPAHDLRDFLFAQKHGLSVNVVIEASRPKTHNFSEEKDSVQLYRKGVLSNDKKDVKEVWGSQLTLQALEKEYPDYTWEPIILGPVADYGKLINSGQFDGLTPQEAMEQIPAAFPDLMEKTTIYKLRDWLISRQRYWGAPIPIVYDPEGKPHPVKEEHLPWMLPTDVDFKPTGESPLRSSQEFIRRTEELYGKGWRPEFDTMDTFVDSSWYYLRYGDARNEREFASKDKIERWLPVDFYMIGPEHIVLHLLYSRFFTKFLRDEGYLKFNEPFTKMRHQGMILGPDGKKMSKSKGNVINPDDVIEKFGADTLRLYEMFMGPIESDKPWDVSAVAGIYRFLSRVYGRVITSIEVNQVQAVGNQDAAKVLTARRGLHKAIKKVTSDVPLLKFNTAIAALMQFMNVWDEQDVALPFEDVLLFVKLLAPFSPFMAEELYQLIVGNGGEPIESVHEQSWPILNPQLAQDDIATVVIQVNGKVRGEIQVEQEKVGFESEIIKSVLTNQQVSKWLKGKEIVKTIYIPGKIVSLVVK